MKTANLMCLEYSSYHHIDTEDQSRLWFDAKDPTIFEELYIYFTGVKEYSIPVLVDETSPYSTDHARLSGVRTFATQ